MFVILVVYHDMDIYEVLETPYSTIDKAREGIESYVSKSCFADSDMEWADTIRLEKGCYWDKEDGGFLEIIPLKKQQKEMNMLKFNLEKIDKRNIDRLTEFWTTFDEDHIQKSLNDTYNKCLAIVSEPDLSSPLKRGQVVNALTQLEELNKVIIR